MDRWPAFSLPEAMTFYKAPRCSGENVSIHPRARGATELKCMAKEFDHRSTPARAGRLTKPGGFAWVS